MTSPGGYSAGTIFLSVVPSFKDFQNSVRREAKAANKAFGEERAKAEKEEGTRSNRAAAARGEADAKAYAGRFNDSFGRALADTRRELKNIKIDVDVNDAVDRLDTVRKHMVDLQKRKIGVNLDSDKALEDLVAMRGELEAIQALAENFNIGVDVDLGAAITQLKVMEAEVEKLRHTVIEVEIKPSGAFAVRLRKQLEAAVAALPEIKLTADSSAVDFELAVIRERLHELSTTDIKPGVDTALAEAEIRGFEERLKQIAVESVHTDIIVNAGTAYAELKKIDFSLDRIDGRRATAHVNVDTDNAERGLAGLLGRLDQNGASMRAFSGRVLGVAAVLPLIVPAALAAAGALGVLSVAAGVAFVGIGTLVAAFSGIGTAVKALDAVHKNAAKDALANSKAIRTAARGVRDAEQGVARARQQAADSATDAARRITDAMRRQKDAEENLRDAQKDAKKAQDNLTKARATAQKQIEDLTLRMRGGAVAERQALVDLFEAQVAYNNAQADSGATNLDKEKASIDLEQARIAIATIREDNAALAEEQQKAAKTGVEGTDAVIQAQDGLEQSNKRVVDAQRAVADAAQSVKDAQVAQARDARDSAIALRDANERLADSQAAYTEAVQKTGDVGSASVQQLNDAMSKLGPAGQAFAIFLEATVMPFLRQIRTVLQEAFLPGVTTFLKTLIGTYGPQISAFLGSMGKVMGDLFVQFGEMLKTPAWRAFFDMLSKQGPAMFKLMGDIAMNFLTIIIQIATAFAPLTKDVLKGLARITKQFSDFLGTPAGKKAMADFLDMVRQVGPDVMKFFVELGRALINLGRALGPYALILLKLFTGFLTFIANMDPTVLGGIVLAILGITLAIQGLLAISSVIGTVAIAVEVAGAPILGVIAAVILIVAALAIAFVLLWTHCETFRDIVKAVWATVSKVIGFYWKYEIMPVFKLIVWYVKLVYTVWSSVFDLIWHIFKAALGKVADAWHWFMETGAGKELGKFGEWLGEKWGGLVGIVQSIWDDIANIFKKGVVFVVDTVINDGLIDGFNWLAGKFGSKKIDRVQLPATMYSDPHSKTAAPKATKFGLATGGMVPGFSPTPTADNIPAMLTAGEFVLPVNAVAGLRAKYGDQFLEMLRRGLPGFANGGLVGFGHMLQARGFRVSENPAFGGVHPVHAKNSLHYKGQAIDVNFGPPGASLEEKKAIDAIIGLAKAYGLRTIWQVAGHFDHAHFDTGSGGNLLGKVGNALGGAGNWLKDKAGGVIGAPLNWLANKVRGTYGSLRDTALGQILIGAPEKLLGMAAHKLIDVGASVGDFFTRDGKDAKGYADGGDVQLYDNGGWLQPGLTTVLNASGRPEPVFSAQQWESIHQGGGTVGGSGDEFHWHAEGGSPEAFADAIMFRKRSASRGGVYAGRVG